MKLNERSDELFLEMMMKVSVCFNSASKCLWTDLEQPNFDVTEFARLFSKTPAKVKSPASTSLEIKKTKLVCLFFAIFELTTTALLALVTVVF